MVHDPFRFMTSSIINFESKSKKQTQFSSWAKKLNEELNYFDWESVPFGSEPEKHDSRSFAALPNAPESFIQIQNFYLLGRGNPKKKEHLPARIIEKICDLWNKNLGSKSETTVQLVEMQFIYFDWNIGTIDYHFQINLNPALKQSEQFLTMIEDFKEFFLEMAGRYQKIQNIQDDDLRNAITKFLISARMSFDLSQSDRRKNNAQSFSYFMILRIIGDFTIRFIPPRKTLCIIPRSWVHRRYRLGLRWKVRRIFGVSLFKTYSIPGSFARIFNTSLSIILRLQDSNQPSILAQQDVMRKFLQENGEEVRLIDPIDPNVPLIGVSLEGSFVIANDLEPRNLSRLIWIWRLAAIYWSGFDWYFNRLTIRVGHLINLSRISRRNARKLRKEMQSLFFAAQSMIGTAAPVTMVTDSTSRILYEKLLETFDIQKTTLRIEKFVESLINNFRLHEEQSKARSSRTLTVIVSLASLSGTFGLLSKRVTDVKNPLKDWFDWDIPADFLHDIFLFFSYLSFITMIGYFFVMLTSRLANNIS